jgi:hypothetical protein
MEAIILLKLLMTMSNTRFSSYIEKQSSQKPQGHYTLRFVLQTFPHAFGWLHGCHHDYVRI